MTVAFTRADVHAIAALAQLELDDAEADLFARQLGEFLDYANQVQSVDTSGVSPTTSVAGPLAGSPEHTSDRDDVVVGSMPRSDALANAPDASPDGFFKVPRVIG